MGGVYMKIPTWLTRFGILVLFLIGVWFLDDFSNNGSISKDNPGHEGFIVHHNGTSYFIEGENIAQSDLQSFSDEDIMNSKKFSSVSVLQGGGLKLGFKGIESGDKVRIWYTEVLEIYPAQIKLTRIEKVDNP